MQTNAATPITITPPSVEPIEREPQCFIGATLIRMADWSQMPISTIKLGDYVKAFDKNGQLHDAKVIGLMSHLVEEYLRIDCGDSSTGTTIEHPYWQGGDTFISIGRFEADHVLRYKDGGWQKLKIDFKAVIFEESIVYNLEIQTYRTYMANDDGVHNAKRLDEFPQQV